MLCVALDDEQVYPADVNRFCSEKRLPSIPGTIRLMDGRFDLNWLPIQTWFQVSAIWSVPVLPMEREYFELPEKAWTYASQFFRFVHCSDLGPDRGLVAFHLAGTCGFQPLG